MTSNIQLISMLVSFLYGSIFMILLKINFDIIKHLNKLKQNIITFIFILDMSVIYSIIIYKINNGYYHIYFIAILFLGFIITYYVYKKHYASIKGQLIVKYHKRT